MNAAAIPQRIFARYNFRGPLISPQEIPSILAVSLSSAITVAGLLLGRLHYDGAAMNPILGALLTLWLCGLTIRVMGKKTFAHGICIFSLYLMLAISITSSSLILATFSGTYADNTLIYADAFLFYDFSWPKMISALEPFRNVLLILSYAYASLDWQAPLLFLCLCLMRAGEIGWRFMTAWSLALIVSLAIFPFCPALGAYGHFAIQHAAVPNVRIDSAWKYPIVLAGIRDGTIGTLTPDHLEGIIAMPSFHAAAAVLLAWGFGHIRLLRWPALALNGAMLISAVPIGGHYIVDVLAGSVVATLAIFVTRAIYCPISAAA